MLTFTPLPDPDAVSSSMRALCRQYPFLRSARLGKSWCGRPIDMLSIGKPNGFTLMVGATHGQEWLTSYLLLDFLSFVCHAFARRRTEYGIDLFAALSARGLCVVPLFNPDGVAIGHMGASAAGKYRASVQSVCASQTGLWQANARGVDLNHNFDAGFAVLRQLEREAGIDAPAPGRYGGTHPHSERETRAIVRLIKRTQPSRLYAFHSQGEEIFWEYGTKTPPDSAIIAKTLAALSGYTLVQNDGLYSHGGLKDWFIETFARPGFTVEIGRGQNPLPPEDLPAIEEKLFPAMVRMLVL